MNQNPKLKVVVTLDGKEYVADLDRLDDKTRKFGDSAEKSAAGASQLGLAMKGVAGAGLAIAAAGLALAPSIVKINAEFERLQSTLNSVEGSTEKGKAAMKGIEALASTTPFQLQDLTQGYIKLKAFGLDPLDGTYQSLIDQAAKLGGSQETLEGISGAVGKAWAKQKLQGEEIMQLLERGVPVWELLAQATGKNQLELQKLSEQGKLGRDAIKLLIDEMGRASFGSAAAQVNTLAGGFSNMQDAAARAARALGEKSGLNDAIKSVQRSVTGLLNSIAGDDSGAKALDTFRTKIEPNIELLRRLGVAVDGIDPTNLADVTRILKAAELNKVDLGKEAKLSGIASQIQNTALSYQGLLVAQQAIVRATGEHSRAAEVNQQKIDALDKKLRALSGAYVDVARSVDQAAKPRKAALNEAPVEFGPGWDVLEDERKRRETIEAARVEAQARERERLAGQVDSLAESLMQEEDLLALSYTRQAEIVANAQQQGIIGEMQAKTVLLALEQDFQKKRYKIEYDAEKKKAELRIGTAKDIASTFSSLTGMFAHESRQAFEIHQAFAIAESMINTYQAYTKTLASLPPPFNYAAAGAVLAAGLAKVHAIGAMSPGGGVSSSPSPPPPNQDDPYRSVRALPESSRDTKGGGAVQVMITGNVYGFADFQETVTQAVREAVDNRDVVIISANSRQAQELRG